MFERNTKQVNRIIARMFAVCTVIILAMAILSYLGVFEFGEQYTLIVLIAGLFITISPSILIRFVSDNFIRHYMLVLLSVFIGILGTNNHIGIYITYALVPIFSCLYFEPALVIRTSIISYIVMGLSLYVNTASKYEVAAMGRPHLTIYIAYLLGFTIEYVIVTTILYFLVKRAKLMMEERYSAQAENRMKSEFLSSMSHEIRTPMNAIIGMTDVALRKDMSDDLRKCITVIRSSSTGLLEIINDILDLSKIEAGKMSIIIDTYTTQSLVEDMKLIVDARNIDKRVPIYYHIQENMPEALEGDAVRIKQVMLNYASNAIKYTKEGRIDITVSCEDTRDGYARLTCTVEDTGQGIREEDKNKLFTMYTQLNEEENHSKEGTGIGLAISKYFIDRMGGTVRVESEFGKGSRFSFTVVQKIADTKSQKAQLEKHHNGTDSEYWFTTKGARVLLVDDNEINREVVKAIVEPLELVIEEAGDGQEAVNMAGKKPYDLIFMDSHMPIMNGEEATREIRQMEEGANKTTPIIALTADAVSGVKERLISGGMDDYIEKPIDVDKICHIIEKYLPQEKIVEK